MQQGHGTRDLSPSLEQKILYLPPCDLCAGLAHSVFGIHAPSAYNAFTNQQERFCIVADGQLPEGIVHKECMSRQSDVIIFPASGVNDQCGLQVAPVSGHTLCLQRVAQCSSSGAKEDLLNSRGLQTHRRWIPAARDSPQSCLDYGSVRF